MEKPTIRIYQEQKPAHYVGEDCSITLKYKANFHKWQIDLVESSIIAVLQINDYTILKD